MLAPTILPPLYLNQREPLRSGEKIIAGEGKVKTKGKASHLNPKEKLPS